MLNTVHKKKQKIPLKKLSKYRDQRGSKRLKGKLSLKSPAYRNPQRFAGRKIREDFSVQLPKYRDQRKLKRLKEKSSLKSPAYRNPQRLGKIFGVGSLNTEIKEN